MKSFNGKKACECEHTHRAWFVFKIKKIPQLEDLTMEMFIEFEMLSYCQLK